ncbi:hypothetical protein D3C86_1947810 [compost metagenome]
MKILVVEPMRNLVLADNGILSAISALPIAFEYISFPFLEMEMLPIKRFLSFKALNKLSSFTALSFCE